MENNNILVIQIVANWGILDWIFWISAIVIAIFSLVFAFIAARQSTRSVEELKSISKSMNITNRVRNEIYSYCVSHVIFNDDAIDELVSKPKVTWFEYRKLSRHTRLNIVGQSFITNSTNTPYALIVDKYNETVTWSNNSFKKIIGIENLSKKTTIPQVTLNNIIKYHRDLSTKLINIIKEYDILEEGLSKND